MYALLFLKTCFFLIIKVPTYIYIDFYLNKWKNYTTLLVRFSRHVYSGLYSKGHPQKMSAWENPFIDPSPSTV